MIKIIIFIIIIAILLSYFIFKPKEKFSSYESFEIKEIIDKLKTLFDKDDIKIENHLEVLKKI